MKFLTLAVLSSVYATSAFASGNLNDVIKKIDKQIVYYQTAPTEERAVKVPWAILDTREANLWSAITAGYDHLKAHGTNDRYSYLYEAAKAASLGHPQRIEALKEWIKKEDKKMKSSWLPAGFFAKWNTHVEKISAAINEAGQARPQVHGESNQHLINKNFSDLLFGIKTDLEAVKPVKATAAVNVSAPVETNDFSLYIFSLFGGFALMAGFFIGKKKGTKKIVRTIIRKVSVKEYLPSLPVEAEIKAEVKPAAPAKIEHSVNLEDECRKIIENHSHLLEMAELKIAPATRSPFRTNVNVPQKKVSEALHWLLKGTIAVANSGGAKVTHLEWNCKEVSGRVSLDFVLHGMECDYKALYMNTLVEGDNSAPAHFGRSEMALEGHLPSVIFKSGNKKTTVSLGLDSISNSMTH